MRRHHDMGGLPAGPVDKREHENALWEKRVDALLVILTGKRPPGMVVDELRRGIEDLPPDAYDTLSYYERWMHAIAQTMVERGTLRREEIDARVAAVKARRREAV